MELKLQREILRLRPTLSVDQVEATAADVFEYWLGDCLEDALDASDGAMFRAKCRDANDEEKCLGEPEYSGYCYNHRRHN